MYLLDTNHLSQLQRRGPAQEYLSMRLEQVPSEQVATAIVCLEEEFRGWMAYLASLRSVEAHVQAYHRLQVLLGNFTSLNVLPFDQAALDVFQELWLRRIRVSTMDLKIAAIALASDATLLTQNTADFARIAEHTPHLRFEDWTVAP
ncbi:MAG: type II toxin-antitoxin system VapC family toxin [Armatimonadetes bacterium]|nr:type II toxin-antitoxin system VapC family toxin [Armatimonadota bacterium]